ncbi:MAG: hypothetical protein IOC49_11465 [Methylobacterium sp.]|nr:hypothetical protein [Methylobacterium sp.]
MNPRALISGFEWTIAWRYLRAPKSHVQAKREPVRVKDMRQMQESGAP